MKFKAFISYSHRDGVQVARALQGCLQKFAKPWYRLRAFRIFRDKSVLAAAPALSVALQNALNSSEYLILLASLEAARSDWVRKEVKYWLDARGPESILIVLLDGKLTWDNTSGDFEWDENTPLPPCLKGRFSEPLYVDMSNLVSAGTLSLSNSQFRDAIATLAASLHGCDKDEIDGEDLHQHRRTLRIAWSAVFTLFLLFSVAVLVAIYAHFQKREAQVRLAQSTFSQSKASSRNFEMREAKRLLLESESMYRELGVENPETVLFRWQNHLQSPPPLNSFRVSDWVSGVALRKDGFTLMTADTLGRVRFWDIRTGAMVGEYTAHDCSITMMALSPDEVNLLTGDEEGVLKLWSIEPWEMKASWKGHENPVRGLAFTPNGRGLISGSSTFPSSPISASEGSLKLWDLSDGRLVHSFEGFHEGVSRLAMFPDGRLVAVAGYWGFLYVMEVKSGRTVRVLDRGPDPELLETSFLEKGVMSLGVSPQGDHIYSGHMNGEVIFWEADGGGRQTSLRKHEGTVLSIAVSAEGRICSGGRDGMIICWSPDTGKHFCEFTDHKDGVTQLTASPGGDVWISIDRSGVAKTWPDFLTQEVMREFKAFLTPVSATALSPGGRLALIGCDTGEVMLWEVATEQLLAMLEPRSEWLLCPVSSVFFTPDGRHAVARALEIDPSVYKEGRLPEGLNLHKLIKASKVCVWDLGSGEIVREISGKPPGLLNAGCSCLSPDGRYAALRADDGVIQIWDVISGEVHRRIPASVSMAKIIFEALAPGGDLFLWVDPKSQAHLWDLAEDREVESFYGISGASFSPDGRYLWLDTEGHGSFLHDLTGKAKPISVTIPGSKFTSVAFEPDGRFLIVGSMDNKIAVWDLRKRQKVFSAPFKMPSAISASKGGGSVLTSSRNSNHVAFLHFSRPKSYPPLSQAVEAALVKIRSDSRDPQALALLGDWYARRGMWKWGGHLLGQARQSGSQAVSPMTYGMCQWKSGDLPGAWDTLSQIPRNGTTGDVHLAACQRGMITQMAETLLADILTAVSNSFFQPIPNQGLPLTFPGRAKALADRIPDGSSPYVLGLRAIALGQPEKAAKLLVEVIDSKHVSRRDIFQGLGAADCAAGNYEEASDWFGKCVMMSDSPDPQIMSLWAAALHRAGKGEGAQRVCLALPAAVERQLEGKRPQFTEELHNCAGLLQAMNREAEARMLCEKAHQIEGTVHPLPEPEGKGHRDDGIDRETLRKLIEMPEMTIIPSPGIWATGYEIRWETRSDSEIRKDIEAVEAKLTAHPGDPDLHLKLARLCEELSDSGRAAQAYVKAAQEYGKLSFVSDLVPEYAYALYRSREADAAVVLLQQHLERNPRSWRSLVLLAHIRYEQAISLLRGDTTSPKEHKDSGSIWSERSREERETIERFLVESVRYGQEAAGIGQDQTAAQFQHYLLSDRVGRLVESIRTTFPGAFAGFDTVSLYKRSILSLQKAAGMEPDNLHILGFAAVVQTRDAMVKTRQPDGAPLRLDALPQDVRGRIQHAIDRLEEGALKPDNHQAATALVWLGQLNYILGERSKAEDQLRRAIKLHPSQDFARQWLLSVLLSSGKMSESAALIRDQLRFKDDLGLRLLLAKTLFRMGQMDDARIELESALRMSPDDFTANLAMACFLMRTQDNAEALLRAARCLESAMKKTSPSDRQAIEYEMLAGINLALRRETNKARERFNRVLQRIPYHPEALAALRAIGP